VKIDIQSPRFSPTEQLINLVNQEVYKLSFLSLDIIGSEVSLLFDSTRLRANRVCRIKLIVPGNDLLAVAQSSTFEESLKKCAEALEKEIGTYKEEIQKKGRKGYKKPGGDFFA
jgi:putative sigma-54 modulation protein